LFEKLVDGAIIYNLLIYGNLVGENLCGGLAVEIDAGVIMDTTSIYASITCSQIQSNPNSYLLVGGFGAILQNPDNSPNPVQWVGCVSQATITLITSNPSNYVQGGFYAFASPHNFRTLFNGSVSAVIFDKLENNNTNKFGFKSDSTFDESSYQLIPSKKFPITSSQKKNIDGIFPDDCICDWNGNDTEKTLMTNLCIQYYNQNDLINDCNCCKGFICPFQCIIDFCPNYYVTKYCMECPVGTCKKDEIHSKGTSGFSTDNPPIIYSRNYPF